MSCTHLQHPGRHDPPHVRGDFSLDAFEVVGSGLVFVFYAQQCMQDAFSQQVWVPVGPPDGSPVPLTAQQLRFHWTVTLSAFNRLHVSVCYFLRSTVEPILKTSFDLATELLATPHVADKSVFQPSFCLGNIKTGFWSEVKTCLRKMRRFLSLSLLCQCATLFLSFVAQHRFTRQARVAVMWPPAAWTLPSIQSCCWAGNGLSAGRVK